MKRTIDLLPTPSPKCNIARARPVPEWATKRRMALLRRGFNP
jgi:hypothetical protein